MAVAGCGVRRSRSVCAVAETMPSWAAMMRAAWSPPGSCARAGIEADMPARANAIETPRNNRRGLRLGAVQHTYPLSLLVLVARRRYQQSILRVGGAGIRGSQADGLQDAVHLVSDQLALRHQRFGRQVDRLPVCVHQPPVVYEGGAHHLRDHPS